MRPESANKRTDSIRVRLAPELLERFGKLADRYGMPPATLAAFAVAQFVQREETNASLARMAVMDMVRRQGEQLEGFEDAIGPALEAVLPAIAQAMAGKTLPLEAKPDEPKDA